jgi:hypothetical protein
MMTGSFRDLLDRLPPLGTPERVAGWLSILIAIGLVMVVVSGSQEGTHAASASPTPRISSFPNAGASQSPGASPALSDLRSVATVEERLAALAASMEREVGSKPTDVGAIAALLRQVNVTIVSGSSSVKALARTPATERLGTDIAAAHADISEAVAATLSQGLTNGPAYMSGGREVVKRLNALAPLDLQVQQHLGGPSPSATPAASRAASPAASSGAP